MKTRYIFLRILRDNVSYMPSTSSSDAELRKVCDTITRLPELAHGTADVSYAAYHNRAGEVWALIRNHLGEVVEYRGHQQTPLTRTRLSVNTDVPAILRNKSLHGYHDLSSSLPSVVTPFTTGYGGGGNKKAGGGGGASAFRGGGSGASSRQRKRPFRKRRGTRRSGSNRTKSPSRASSAKKAASRHHHQRK